MKLSPLQLIHSQFLAVSVVARQVDLEALTSGTDLYPASDADQIETSIALGHTDQDDPRQFVVKVSIHTARDLAADLPYQFAMQLEGIFRIDHDGDLDERKRLVVINGGAMLIGIAREQLLALTLRHKNGPLLLPSIDLRGLAPKKRETAPEEPGADSRPEPRKRRPTRKKRAAPAS